jgi:hypothetical protein
MISAEREGFRQLIFQNDCLCRRNTPPQPNSLAKATSMATVGALKIISQPDQLRIKLG